MAALGTNEAPWCPKGCAAHHKRYGFWHGHQTAAGDGERPRPRPRRETLLVWPCDRCERIMRNPTEVRTLLRRGQRAICEIRGAPDKRGGYALWVRSVVDDGHGGEWVSREDGVPMRFPDPVKARQQAQALGFPHNWIRVARPAPLDPRH